MARPTGKELAGWVIAAALLVTGVVALAIGASTPASFGWFAYQPLADAVFTPGGDVVLVPRVTIAGFVAVSLGLITLAFVAGWRLAKRSSS